MKSAKQILTEDKHFWTMMRKQCVMDIDGISTDAEVIYNHDMYMRYSGAIMAIDCILEEIEMEESGDFKNEDN